MLNPPEKVGPRGGLRLLWGAPLWGRGVRRRVERVCFACLAPLPPLQRTFPFFLLFIRMIVRLLCYCLWKFARH